MSSCWSLAPSPKITAAVATPGVEVPVRTDGVSDVVVPADGLWRHTRGELYHHWHGTVGGAAIAQLPSAVITPCVEVAVRADGVRKPTGTGNRCWRHAGGK